ncbi:endolytic transglycosylase MltG [Streptomyces sp. MUM 178J]|uniref:endolytic transglycosylase MltG n=1 Tax=Streptomyces sp. MUM 178J TaxID=2791991 RepID=UPI001F035214|nr:endolytic transglycosylase MltG [Streptomyces sp. MUM 178J]WRQ78273.1 endolytic transglycosylase MltG [Streptomyces sp. MUM 178J]
MMYEPPPERSGRRLRLTRRGRLVLIVTMAAAACAAVLIPLLVLQEEPKPEKQPEKRRTLLIPEGWRASQVYRAVDKALGKPPGATRKAAATADLKLPAEAKGNPEGYLFPATYPVDPGATPAGLLAYMVDTAHKRFAADSVSAGAQRSGAGLYRTVNIASIVQAEVDAAADMGKVARVIHNRLKQGMPLQMDSTLNYALNRSTLDTTLDDTRLDSPYNTYLRLGLPPTPIGNPGEEALRAALDPPEGDWMYFVTVARGDTRFTADYAEHRRNVEEFNARRRSAGATAGTDS